MRFYTWLILTGVLVLSACAPKSRDLSLLSPDGKTEVRFLLKNGQLFYTVQAHLTPLLSESRLGFELADHTALKDHFQVVHSRYTMHDTTWEPVWGTDAVIRDHFNQLQVDLKTTDSLARRLTIVFRAYNDGVAFRYIFPEQKNLKEFNISRELTQFNFSGDFSAWWNQADFDSYEHLYRHTPLSKIPAANTPVTMQAGKHLFLSVHEAALTDYAGMTLKQNSKNKTHFECDLVPWPDGVKVKGTTPFQTPWRTIQIAERPGRLIESHLIENLNEPCKIKDTSWIQPMKYVGIWWGMHINKYTWHAGPKHGATTRRAMEYMEFAAKNDIPGILIEGWNRGWESWLSGNNVQSYTQPYPDFDLKKVAAYARKNGLYLIGHHESGGNVPEYESQMEAAMDLYRSLGVHAVKTGYAGKMHPLGQHHHGQWNIRHYRKVVREAAKRQIMIDAHEPVKPTGIRRTWPNMMTREGVRGMEYNAWSEGNPPEHTTIIPFTRMLAGPLDYTPGIFNIKFDPTGKHRVYTTLAKQLALYVVLYSPLQMAADLVENYKNQPAFRFIKEVPVNWDETRVLDAVIGDYVLTARRKGNEWFVGGITDEHPRDLSFKLDFLVSGKPYVVELYRDGDSADYETNPAAVTMETIKRRSADELKVHLVKSGGFAARFYPESKEE